MMTPRQFAAVLGFAFVAVWITLGFGWAVLCLVGAAVFYAAATIVEGGITLPPDIQARLGRR